MGILAVSSSTARHLGEIGFIIGAVGAILLVLDSLTSSPAAGRSLPRLVGSALIAVGFILGIFYVHTI